MLCWGSPRWGVRRLLGHVANLPRDAAFSRALRGEHAYWDEQVELTAQLVDAMRANSYYLLRVNGNDATEPTPVPRPGESGQPEAGTLADFNALLSEG